MGHGSDVVSRLADELYSKMKCDKLQISRIYQPVIERIKKTSGRGHHKDFCTINIISATSEEFPIEMFMSLLSSCEQQESPHLHSISKTLGTWSTLPFPVTIVPVIGFGPDYQHGRVSVEMHSDESLGGLASVVFGYLMKQQAYEGEDEGEEIQEEEEGQNNEEEEDDPFSNMFGDSGDENTEDSNAEQTVTEMFSESGSTFAEFCMCVKTALKTLGDWPLENEERGVKAVHKLLKKWKSKAPASEFNNKKWELSRISDALRWLLVDGSDEIWVVPDISKPWPKVFWPLIQELKIGVNSSVLRQLHRTVEANLQPEEKPSNLSLPVIRLRFLPGIDESDGAVMVSNSVLAEWQTSLALEPNDCTIVGVFNDRRATSEVFTRSLESNSIPARILDTASGEAKPRPFVIYMANSLGKDSSANTAFVKSARAELETMVRAGGCLPAPAVIEQCFAAVTVDIQSVTEGVKRLSNSKVISTEKDISKTTEFAECIKHLSNNRLPDVFGILIRRWTKPTTEATSKHLFRELVLDSLLLLVDEVAERSIKIPASLYKQQAQDLHTMAGADKQLQIDIDDLLLEDDVTTALKKQISDRIVKLKLLKRHADQNTNVRRKSLKDTLQKKRGGRSMAAAKAEARAETLRNQTKESRELVRHVLQEFDLQHNHAYKKRYFLDDDFRPMIENHRFKSQPFQTLYEIATSLLLPHDAAKDAKNVLLNFLEKKISDRLQQEMRTSIFNDGKSVQTTADKIVQRGIYNVNEILETITGNIRKIDKSSNKRYLRIKDCFNAAVDDKDFGLLPILDQLNKNSLFATAIDGVRELRDKLPDAAGVQALCHEVGVQEITDILGARKHANTNKRTSNVDSSPHGHVPKRMRTSKK